MPVAAIEALILLLVHHPPSTISETLSLLSTHTTYLKRAVRNSIPLSAGTDLFQRYLISTLQSRQKAFGRGSAGGKSPAGSTGGKSPAGRAAADEFKAMRAHLMANGRLFVQRAKEARGKIADVARRFVRDGSTVMASGSSRVVSAVLTAASAERIRFRVVYVRSSSPESSSGAASKFDPSAKIPRQPPSLVTELRGRGVPVAEIGEGSVAYAMREVDMVFSGAEGVVENGGVINELGTYQLALLAQSAGKPFYVVVESHKFVRLYPLGQYDLGIEQTVLDFRDRNGEDGGDESDKAATGGGEEGDASHTKGVGIDAQGTSKYETSDAHSPAEVPRMLNAHSAVDFTPPELITALVTESGVHTPSAVSEELINIWY